MNGKMMIEWRIRMKYMYWILDLIQTICNILKSHLVAYSVLTVASYIVIATDDDFFL